MCAASGVSVIKFSNTRHENSGLGKARAEFPVQKSGGEALPSIPMSPSASSTGSADIFSIGKQKKGPGRDRTPDNQASAADGHSSPRAPAPTSTNQSVQPAQPPRLDGNE